MLDWNPMASYFDDPQDLIQTSYFAECWMSLQKDSNAGSIQSKKDNFKIIQKFNNQLNKNTSY